ncbi:hypothetical protein MHYP_G00050260, partial [Metynnis hypsauchen]
MLLTFYLLFIGLHVSEGCTLMNNEKLRSITAHTGGSVLLPCYCTDLHTKPKTFIWRKYNTKANTWEVISSESGQYRHRVQLVNGHSPGNLSLLISHLTEEDGGHYRCDDSGAQYIDIRLIILDCTLVKNKHESFIKAHTGGSVLLPCFCTDLHTKPETFTWKKLKTTGMTWQVLSNESGQHRKKVQLVNGHSPGNLSLLISHLTEEDGGVYRCDIGADQHIDLMLTVEEGPPQTTPPTVVDISQTSSTISFPSSSQTPAYCTLVKSDHESFITAHTGGSVLLPCYCTDLHTTPERFTWKKLKTNIKTWQVISSESGQYRNRVQLVNGHSPGNLSLLISHLTEEDGGVYTCNIGAHEHIDIILMVEDRPTTTLPPTAVDNNQTATPTAVTPTAVDNNQTTKRTTVDNNQTTTPTAVNNSQTTTPTAVNNSQTTTPTAVDNSQTTTPTAVNNSQTTTPTAVNNSQTTTPTAVDNSQTTTPTAVDNSQTISSTSIASYPQTSDDAHRPRYFFIPVAVLLLLVLGGVFFYWKHRRQKRAEGEQGGSERDQDRQDRKTYSAGRSELQAG